MSLFISLGTNLGDKYHNIDLAKKKLLEKFTLVDESNILETKAVDYIDQPDFLNQVLEFELPEVSPQEAMEMLLTIEIEMGRVRDISKGPRIIDLDILFWGELESQDPIVTIPHPSWHERPFIIELLGQLKNFEKLRSKFI